MSKAVWIITVVDPTVQRWAPVQGLVRCGAPVGTVAKYVRVRRTMTAAGLRKKLREQVN